jgi:threonine/homoserine/homoserine lactone efflux protein
MFLVFIQSMLIGYSGAVMPGPMLTYTIEKSVRKGAKTGIVITLGHALLELVVVVLIFLGVGKYLSAGPVKTAIGLIGGIILVYLGLGMIKDVWKDKISFSTESSEKISEGSTFLAGVVLSATNPYFLIWWTAVGLALIMAAYNAYGVIGVVLFYVGHIVADISWYIFVSALVARTRHLLNIKVLKGVIVVLALCLVGFGVSFFVDSLKYFLA